MAVKNILQGLKTKIVSNKTNYNTKGAGYVDVSGNSTFGGSTQSLGEGLQLYFKDLGYLSYEDLYNGCSDLTRAIDLLKTNISSVDLYNYDCIEKEFTDGENPLIQLLKKPAINQGYKSFVEQFFLYYYLYGNVYLSCKKPANGEIESIQLVDPRDVTINTSKGGRSIAGHPTSYTVNNANRYGDSNRVYDFTLQSQNTAYYVHKKAVGKTEQGEVIYDDCYLFHYKNSSSKKGCDYYKGDSPVEPIKGYCALMISGIKANVELFKRDNKRTGLYSINPPIQALGTQSPAEELKKIVDNTAKANEKAKKEGGDILAPYATFTDFTAMPKDLNYGELFKLAKESIYQNFNIPLPLALSGETTYNNMSQAPYQLWTQKLIPDFEQFVDFLNSNILPLYDNFDILKYKIWFKRTDIDSINEIEIDKVLSQSAYRSINETRQALGIEVNEEQEQDEIYNTPEILLQLKAKTESNTKQEINDILEEDV